MAKMQCVGEGRDGRDNSDSFNKIVHKVTKHSPALAWEPQALLSPAVRSVAELLLVKSYQSKRSLCFCFFLVG